MQIFADKKFEHPIQIIEAFDNKSFIEAFKEIEKLRKNHYLLGYIRYESKEIFLGKEIKSEYPLLYFEVYNKFSCHCEERRMSYAAIQEKGFGLLHCVCNDNQYEAIQPKAVIDYQTYSKAIKQIKEEIACGNTYQVNYTYDYKIETSGIGFNLDGFDLYKSILPRQTTPYNAYIKNKYEEILSFSPELFFELENNIIKTKPMKGTVKRGKTKAEDKKNIEFLKNDIKNRAENVMIVDLLRNDLGKIAKTGTVKVDKLFEVETHNTLHQMTSEISAELEEKTTLFEIFEAIFPCGSITGAPKINTMKIIDELEVGSREVYCGAIGLISPEKTVFSVPIRTLQRHNNESFFSCRVGGAIVWDSTPKDEWEETLTKIKFLRHCKCSDTRDFKLIETILVKNGKLKYKTAHFTRMKKSAKKLGFEFHNEIFKIKPKKDGILRVLLSKDGSFETNYLSLEPVKTNKISISKTAVSSRELLLNHKTTYRPWYDKTMIKIKQGKIFDELFFNEKGELTEGSRSNIILKIGNKLFTPPAECGLLNGILRQNLLKQGKIEAKKLYVKDLQKAEKIFCINSVRGIVEVKVEG